jgi:hypothetical protein
MEFSHTVTVYVLYRTQNCFIQILWHVTESHTLSGHKVLHNTSREEKEREGGGGDWETHVQIGYTFIKSFH